MDSVFHIERGDLLDILEHPKPDRYAGQRIFDVRRDDYGVPGAVRFRPASSRRGYGEVSPKRFARRRTSKTSTRSS